MSKNNSKKTITKSGVFVKPKHVAENFVSKGKAGVHIYAKHDDVVLEPIKVSDDLKADNEMLINVVNELRKDCVKYEQKLKEAAAQQQALDDLKLEIEKLRLEKTTYGLEFDENKAIVPKGYFGNEKGKFPEELYFTLKINGVEQSGLGFYEFVAIKATM